jgi:hemerythrin superfamily protein
MKQQDAIALLKADHKAVKALFKQSEELSDRAKAQVKRLGDQICKELTVHTQLEEQILYPRTKERAGKKKSKEESDLVLESYEEHNLAKHVIADLRAIDGSDESYKPKLKVLSELIDSHVKEEEKEMFPGLRELFDDEELVQMGQQMLELKTQLQETPLGQPA